MTTIRTPDDEVDRPGYYYPPFTENWWYQGSTYAGHSDASVDWNRRTKTGGWLDDTGDPVYAAADGTVAEVDPLNGLVMLNHWGGLYRTEYRHMTGPFPKVGDKVKRGDRIGSIGDVAGDGRSIGAHLHHVHYKRASTAAPFTRIQMRFYDEPVEVSVPGSDKKPATWKAPAPVMVQGPPPKATWESAAKDAIAELAKAERAAQVAAGRLTDARAQVTLVTDERDQAKRDLATAQARIAELDKSLAWAQADLAACKAATAPDCTDEVDRALIAEQKLDDIRAVLAR